ncbi:exonuclease SbcCD subunit D [Roseburia hominis]
MKLLHTSDWHFGMAAGVRSLAEDQRYFLEQLYEIIEKEQVDAVLLAGDVYDSSVANAEAISMYNDATTKICGEMKLPFIIIAGNHDGAARLASCRELLKGAGLFVTGRLTREIAPVLLRKQEGAKEGVKEPGAEESCRREECEETEIAVYPIPFFNRDEVIALFPERKEEIISQEMAYKVVCDHIRETMDPGRINIVMAHAMIVNAELSESDRTARVGQALAVSKEVFEGFDYVALGHIHKPQKITERIRYSGSPLKYSFGKEEEQQKCVLILDTDTMEVREIPLVMRHDRKTVTGTYEELIKREELAGDCLRLYVTDRYAGLELLGELREHFPYLLELYGKSLEETDKFTSLSISELESLDEVDIMMKFCGENFVDADTERGYVPGAEQIALFREVLEWSEKEAEMS